MTEFAGGVFSPELEGGREGATLEVSPGRIGARTRAGQRFEVAPERCELELGGASGRMWFCRDRATSLTLFSEQPGFGAALAALPALEDQVRALTARRHARRRRSALAATLGLAAAALLLVGGIAGVLAAGRTAIRALPPSVDEKLGSVALATMDLGGPVVQDRVVTSGVERVVARLAAHADGDFDYEVQVVDAPTVNAFALPGGRIVIYTGLIQEAPTLEGVAGVLAHEIAHVTQRHGLERIGQSLGLAAAAQLLLGDVSGLAALVVDLVQAGALTSYGRDQERAADAEGMRILHAAGIDPRALAQIFERLAEEQPEAAAPVSWLSSHPELEERIATVEATAERMGPPEPRPLDVDFEELRGRLRAAPDR